jgi:hypothetical protein
MMRICHKCRIFSAFGTMNALEVDVRMRKTWTISSTMKMKMKVLVQWMNKNVRSDEERGKSERERGGGLLALVPS